MGERCSQRQRIGASEHATRTPSTVVRSASASDGPSYDRHRCGDHVDNACVDGGKVDMITGKGDDPWTRRTQATGSVISSSVGSISVDSHPVEPAHADLVDDGIDELGAVPVLPHLRLDTEQPAHGPVQAVGAGRRR